MDEEAFWIHLEFRVCREFAGMPDRHLRWLWCDGFTPDQYLLDGPSPRIIGQTWICNGPSQDAWSFVLHLPGEVRSRDDIHWESLLPPENVTRWLALDVAARYIEIEPRAALPDPA